MQERGGGGVYCSKASNAEEKLAGATITNAEHITFDMTLQLGGEERERETVQKRGSALVSMVTETKSMETKDV